MAVPTITTQTITIFGSESAQGGGNVTYDGGKTLSAKGICWNTTGTPTILDNKTDNGISVGIYNSTMLSLIAGTLYYVRAYATNADGTGYGAQVTFTTLSIKTPTLKSAFFEIRDISDKVQQKPNIKNIGFSWNEPVDPIPNNPKIRTIWFEWGRPDYFKINKVNGIFIFGGL